MSDKHDDPVYLQGQKVIALREKLKAEEDTLENMSKWSPWMDRTKETQCPHCGHWEEFPPTIHTFSRQCSHCGEKFDIEAKVTYRTRRAW